MGIRLPSTAGESYIEGSITSNEIGKDDDYMLLSLHAQSTLGFIKDTTA